MKDLEALERQILLLNQSTKGGRVRPHKLALLLSVLEAMDEGVISANRIECDKDLRARFSKYFGMLAQEGETPRVARPFYHLASSLFCHHKVREGKEDKYQSIRVADWNPLRECVEYAYFSDDVFQLLQSAKTRDELRGFIMRIAQSSDEKTQSLSFTFHRSFTLMREGVSQVLGCAARGTELSKQNVHRATALGLSQAEAMPRYAQRAGLVDTEDKPTLFGLQVLEQDASLSRIETMWMMHYYLSAPFRNTPNFWAHLVSMCLASEQEFTRAQVAEHLAQFAADNSARTVQEKALDQTATVFLGTYAKPDALGPLRLLEEVDKGKGRYRAREDHAELPAGVLACALGDFWSARFGESPQVNLAEVSGSGGLAPIFFLSKGAANRALASLQAARLVAMHTLVPPYQIAREWSQADDLWPHLYSLGQPDRADSERASP